MEDIKPLELAKKHPLLVIGTVGALVVLFLVIQSQNKGQAATASTSSTPVGTSGQGSANLGTVTIQTQSSGLAPVSSSTGGGGIVPLQNLPTTSATTLTGPATSPAPVPGPTAGTSTPAPSNNNTPSTNTQSAPPTYGLLGPNVSWATANKDLVNLPQGTKLISGGQGRIWEVNQQGIQTLVTSGSGPAVTNSGYKNGQGPPTPGAHP